jgi:zinc transporter ZupT
MTDTFLWVTLFAMSSTIVNTAGIYAVYKNKGWVEKARTYLMCFAAGLLISSPLMFALPNAIKANYYAGVSALIGFLFMFLSNEFIKSVTKQKSLAFGITAIEGIGIHSFVDGITYSVTFSSSILIGFLSGLGLVVHEFAEGAITFSVLTIANIEKKRAAFYAFLVAGLTTPAGAFIVYPIVSRLNSSLLGLALGFVSGVLIYISSAHLLPEARGYEREHSAWAFLSGVLLAVFLVIIKSL